MAVKKIANGNNTILNMFKLLIDLEKCVKEKCKIERKKIEKSADMITINNLREDFKNQKITTEKFLEQFSKIKLNILKSELRDELIKCQIDKCYSDTKKVIDNSVSNILNSKIYSKDEPIYKLAKKIVNYKDKKLTIQDIKDLDIESHIKMYGKYIKK
jgi:predicted  nucleic acid-binding Zn-ribbon protein